MRGRITRYGRIDTQAYRADLDRHVKPRRLVVAYGLVLVVLAVLWAISYPMLSGGAIALVGGGYAMGRISLRVARRRLGAGRTVCVPGTRLCLET